MVPAATTLAFLLMALTLTEGAVITTPASAGNAGWADVFPPMSPTGAPPSGAANPSPAAGGSGLMSMLTQGASALAGNNNLDFNAIISNLNGGSGGAGPTAYDAGAQVGSGATTPSTAPADAGSPWLSIQPAGQPSPSEVPAIGGDLLGQASAANSPTSGLGSSGLDLLGQSSGGSAPSMGLGSSGLDLLGSLGAGGTGSAQSGTGDGLLGSLMGSGQAGGNLNTGAQRSRSSQSKRMRDIIMMIVMMELLGGEM